MSFVSQYYKKEIARGLGSIFNIVWISVVIVVGGIIMMYNVQCTIDGRCEFMAWLVVALLIAFTGLNIGLGVYRTVTYKAPITTKVSQETKKV